MTPYAEHDVWAIATINSWKGRIISMQRRNESSWEIPNSRSLVARLGVVNPYWIWKRPITSFQHVIRASEGQHATLTAYMRIQLCL